MTRVISRRRQGRVMSCFARAARSTVMAASALIMVACGDGSSLGPGEDSLEASVARLEVVSGDVQRVWGGRRSVEPFRVRALGADAQPVSGARVRFTLDGKGGGVLSQPDALTDKDGFAETF